MSKISNTSQDFIEDKIFNIRNVQVMLDSDLALLYKVSTGRLNEQVKRNIERFPSDFMFQLTIEEWVNLKSQIAISSDHGGRRKPPFVFTEQGVAGLSGVLKSEIAVKVHVSIMRAFVALRRVVNVNHLINARLDTLEQKQIETNQKFEQIFNAMEKNEIIPSQGVFFEGQVFDAYELASKIIRSAKESIVLIDNFLDESTLTHLAKKRKGINVLLLTRTVSKQLSLDVKKANQQYGNFEIEQFTHSHDRFLIIDKVEVYHLGASLKDLGRKWFAFSKLDRNSVNNILVKVKAKM